CAREVTRGYAMDYW
nr:immunoglobulin heavy chain junction region [Mus musculus]